MRRRSVLTIAVAAVAVPVQTLAQRSRSARLGVLHDSGRDGTFNAMFKRLGELGWVEGKNLVIEFHQLDRELKEPASIVRQMVRLKCDVIFANGTPAAMAVKTSAPGMPMVFAIGGDPVVSYGISWPALILRSADYLAHILDGAKPADLPVLQPSQFELVVDLWRARYFGQTLPRSLLLQATEVFE
jgi:ABC-type uncharacterized transport system substrate-binding protein